MPGKLLLIDGIQRITKRTDVLPWILIGISSLAALLLYGFVREVFDDDRVALASAALYLFLPARTFFFPLMNTVTPVVAFTCAWLLARWLSTGSTAYALLMGIGLYGLAFFEPLPFVLGLLFLALAVLAVLRGSITWDRFIAQALALIAVFIGVAELVNLTSGFDIVRAFRTIGGHAAEFNESAERPYGLWVTANLREFAFGMGICQVVVFCGALLYALRQPGNWRERLSHPLSAICAGLIAVLLAVDLIGMNRGEVIRLWIFLACLFQIPVAYVLLELEQSIGFGASRGRHGPSNGHRPQYDQLRHPVKFRYWLIAIVVLAAALRFVPIWFGLPFAQARPDETAALGLGGFSAVTRSQSAFLPLAFSHALPFCSGPHRPVMGAGGRWRIRVRSRSRT